MICSLGRVKNRTTPKREAYKHYKVTSQSKSPRALRQQENNTQEEEGANGDVLLYMEILVKQGQKVKLKIKRNDDPMQVAANFSKIYGLNLRSQDALA